MVDPNDGKEKAIAVKLIHPHVEAMVRTDMDILRFFASVIELIPNIEYLSLKDTVEEFARSMIQQMDLRLEATNCYRFLRNFRDKEHVKFPTPIPGFIRKNVLVEVSNIM